MAATSKTTIPHTHVWLARSYKISVERSIKGGFKPKLSQSETKMRLVLAYCKYDSTLITCELNMDHIQVKKFKPKHLNWDRVASKGGHHLQLIGRIKLDGTIDTDCMPVEYISDMGLLVDDFTGAFKEVISYAQDRNWILHLPVVLNPHEEKLYDE